MILILGTVGLISSLFLISYPFYVISVERFIIFGSLFYIMANVAESFTSALLAKIYPPNLAKIGICNAGFTIIFSTTGGKLTGATLITVLALLGGAETLGNKLFGLYSVLLGLLVFSIYYKYGDLRVKAIARIIQRKALH